MALLFSFEENDSFLLIKLIENDQKCWLFVLVFFELDVLLSEFLGSELRRVHVNFDGLVKGHFDDFLDRTVESGW